MKRYRRFAILAFVLLAAIAVLEADSFSQQNNQPGPLITLDLPAPALTGSQADWINTGGRSVTFEKGRVYVVHFWTFGCINCQRNLPAYTQWQARYANAPLTLVGVHSPETARERDANNVTKEVRRLAITYPVLVDGKLTNWNQWQQHIWPTVYLVDKRGHVRYYWLGELEWQGAGGTQIMQQCIEQLLNEPDPLRLPERRYP